MRSETTRVPVHSTGEGKSPEGMGSVRTADPPSSEVLAKPRRRSFKAEYKLRVLEEADRCADSGQIGALLRREGLYSSHLSAWRRQRERGTLVGLSPKKRGAKSKKNPLETENQALKRQVKQLEKRLKKTEIINEFQKKLFEILEIPVESPPEFEEPK